MKQRLSISMCCGLLLAVTASAQDEIQTIDLESLSDRGEQLVEVDREAKQSIPDRFAKRYRRAFAIVENESPEPTRSDQDGHPSKGGIRFELPLISTTYWATSTIRSEHIASDLRSNH